MTHSSAIGDTPTELRTLLSDGAAQLGVPLEPAQAQALLDYVDLLVRWNATYNLTAVRDRHAIVTHHLLDCLAVLPSLRCELGTHPGKRVLDVGSGAGLPGLVIGVMEPGVEVICVDSVGKKAAFIAQAAAALGAGNVQAVHARVERLDRPAFDVITSRAFASLADLVRRTDRLLVPGGVWMAMKGKTPDDELMEVADLIEHDVEPLVVPHLTGERCLVWMHRTSRCELALTSGKYAPMPKVGH